MYRPLLVIFFQSSLITTSAQDFQWARRVGSPMSEYAYGMTVDDAGNVYTVGRFQDTTDFDPDTIATYNLISAGAADAFISKLDGNGNFIYAVGFGDVHDDCIYGVEPSDSGSVIVAGSFHYAVDFDPDPVNTHILLAYSNAQDGFLLKLDSLGKFVWVKQFSSKVSVLFLSMTFDASNNILLTGSCYDTTDFDPGPGVYNVVSAGLGDIFALKLDPNGNFIWVSAAQGPESSAGYDIVTDASGFVYVAGYFESTVDFDPGPGMLNYTPSGVYYDGFIWKLDYNGIMDFVIQIGGNELDEARSITIDPAGYLYTVGNFKGTVDFNPDVSQTQYYSSYNNTYDLFILKTDLAGNYIWAKQVQGTINEYFFCVEIDPAGNLYAGGEFYGDIDADPGNSVHMLTGGGGTDGLLLKLDASGNFLWAGQITGTFGQSIYSMKLHGPDTLYASGFFWGQSDLDMTPGTFSMPAYGQTDVFITRLGATPTGIDEPADVTNQLKIFPNPCHRCTVTGISDPSQLSVTDLLGREVHVSTSVISGGIEITLPQSNTLYFVKDLHTGRLARIISSQQ